MVNVPLDRVAQSEHTDMAKLAAIFHHDIVDESGVWRWKPNSIIRHMIIGGPIHLNLLWLLLYQGNFTVEEMMKLYMQIGYSLSGYRGIWDAMEANEFGLPDALPSNPSYKTTYAQTPIEYMLLHYEGKTLNL